MAREVAWHQFWLFDQKKSALVALKLTTEQANLEQSQACAPVWHCESANKEARGEENICHLLRDLSARNQRAILLLLLPLERATTDFFSSEQPKGFISFFARSVRAVRALRSLEQTNGRRKKIKRSRASNLQLRPQFLTLTFEPSLARPFGVALTRQLGHKASFASGRRAIKMIDRLRTRLAGKQRALRT